MIVAIDGPAGAGKSSVARRLAHHLGFQFLDTGAMYRAITLAALRRHYGAGDADAIADMAQRTSLILHDNRVLLDGFDVTGLIRTSEVAASVYLAADNRRVRERLVHLQREFAEGSDTVTEGRDQGTVAFPHAECKIYLTASPEERATRRHTELQARGEQISWEEVLRQINDRDRRDMQREFGPLRRADDAIDVCTDGLSTEQVIVRLESIVRERQQKLSLV
ncbi:Cytidylate kinase [Anatilimnocola aggregata]|uniref:Cytidylate kinase n=1 Tax=Anatilimnocola aggregata TaxID=2528021 RepID=A0A517YEN4_9BACT|nr:(d)CMP kinase [Anatilimnocola aggregata]QDU28612.1 Cytidylate kinase [Anatilimnocola aggregata]